MVTGAERTEYRLFVYRVLFNQKLPTNPITKDLDVGWRLALASKATGFVTGVSIMARFIRVIGGYVKAFVTGFCDRADTQARADTQVDPYT